MSLKIIFANEGEISLKQKTAKYCFKENYETEVE